MEQQFSIGEWVERKFDGAVGVVKKVQESEPEGDFYFYVDLAPHSHRGGLLDTDLWAGTTGAWRRHFRLHAHVETSSRDCDGDYSGGHTDEMTTQERCDQFGDLHFKERVLGNVVTLHGEGTLEVSPSGLHWHEQTEEGYRRADVTWCEDECEDERPWQRDHRAEAAGY
jgi:hypothetical protein